MRQPSGLTHLYAIVAHPVTHVRASEFLNPLIERAGRDAFLVPFHVLPEDLEATVMQLRAVRNLKGLIVTIPHKPVMAKLCTRLGRAGKLTGTVNTVRIETDGTLTGDMFDGVGLIEGARAHDMDPQGRHVLILGCGGAGRAIAFALAELGVASLTLANRTFRVAEELAEAVRVAYPGIQVRAGPADGRGQDLIIQCTSLGLHAEDPLPMDPASIEAGSRLFEIIAARDTELMQEARARGARVIGGRPMIEHQAAAQIEFLDAPMLAGH